jgi:hypothetical protein
VSAHYQVIDSKVAKRKKKKSNRFQTILLFVLAPLIVWALAMLIWLYWNDLAKSFTPGKDRPEPAGRALRNIEKDAARGRSDEAQPKENILDADRKKLDEIIRRENHKTSGNK